MIKKYFKYILVIFVLIIGFSSFFLYKKLATPKKVHYHAGFVVLKDDKKIDFSDFKYMRIKPCSLDKNHKVSDEDIQAEKAHLHDLVGDVVHVEQENAYWRDLFSNIHYKLDYSKVTAFINGKNVNHFENQRIQPDESLIILIGNNTSNHIQDGVKKEYIEEKAKKSVDCD